MESKYRESCPAHESSNRAELKKKRPLWSLLFSKPLLPTSVLVNDLRGVRSGKYQSVFKFLFVVGPGFMALSLTQTIPVLVAAGVVAVKLCCNILPHLCQTVFGVEMVKRVCWSNFLQDALHFTATADQAINRSKCRHYNYSWLSDGSLSLESLRTQSPSLMC